MDIFKIRVAALCLLLFVFTSACTAARQSTRNILPLQPQQKSEYALTNLEGESQDLSLIVRSHPATVLMWWATQCPCVKRYQKRMEMLADKYRSQNVSFAAISSNADDDLGRIQRVYEKRKLTIPLFKDEGGKLAALIGARTTPTVAIIDQEGKVRYLGWFDNEKEPGQSGRTAYVEDALTAIIQGDPPPHESSRAFGCLITKNW
jgi:peroxiredoxin